MLLLIVVWGAVLLKCAAPEDNLPAVKANMRLKTLMDVIELEKMGLRPITEHLIPHHLVDKDSSEKDALDQPHGMFRQVQDEATEPILPSSTSELPVPQLQESDLDEEIDQIVVIRGPIDLDKLATSRDPVTADNVFSERRANSENPGVILHPHGKAIIIPHDSKLRVAEDEDGNLVIFKERSIKNARKEKAENSTSDAFNARASDATFGHHGGSFLRPGGTFGGHGFATPQLIPTVPIVSPGFVSPGFHGGHFQQIHPSHSTFFRHAEHLPVNERTAEPEKPEKFDKSHHMTSQIIKPWGDDQVPPLFRLSSVDSDPNWFKNPANQPFPHTISQSRGQQRSPEASVPNYKADGQPEQHLDGTPTPESKSVASKLQKRSIKLGASAGLPGAHVVVPGLSDIPYAGGIVSSIVGQNSRKQGGLPLKVGAGFGASNRNVAVGDQYQGTGDHLDVAAAQELQLKPVQAEMPSEQQEGSMKVGASAGIPNAHVSVPATSDIPFAGGIVSSVFDRNVQRGSGLPLKVGAGIGVSNRNVAVTDQYLDVASVQQPTSKSVQTEQQQGGLKLGASAGISSAHVSVPDTSDIPFAGGIVSSILGRNSQKGSELPLEVSAGISPTETRSSALQEVTASDMLHQQQTEDNRGLYKRNLEARSSDLPFSSSMADSFFRRNAEEEEGPPVEVPLNPTPSESRAAEAEPHFHSHSHTLIFHKVKHPRPFHPGGAFPHPAFQISQNQQLFVPNQQASLHPQFVQPQTQFFHPQQEFLHAQALTPPIQPAIDPRGGVFGASNTQTSNIHGNSNSVSQNQQVTHDKVFVNTGQLTNINGNANSVAQAQQSSRGSPPEDLQQSARVNEDQAVKTAEVEPILQYIIDAPLNIRRYPAWRSTEQHSISKRAVDPDVEDLFRDPNLTIDVPQTAENIGSVKNVVMSAMKVPPQDFIIPSQYKIVNRDELEHPVGSRRKVEHVRSVNDGEEPYDEYDDPFNVVDTFHKVGAAVRDSIRSSQETLSHVGEVAHNARKAVQTARQNVPQKVLPVVLGRSKQRQPEKVTIIAPKVLAIKRDDEISRAPVRKPIRGGFVKVADLMDALGVTNPDSEPVKRQKIVLRKKPTNFRVGASKQHPRLSQVEIKKYPILRPIMTSRPREKKLKDYVTQMRNNFDTLVKDRFQDRRMKMVFKKGRNDQKKSPLRERMKQPLVKVQSRSKQDDVLGAQLEQKNAVSDTEVWKTQVDTFLTNLFQGGDKDEETVGAPQSNIHRIIQNPALLKPFMGHSSRHRNIFRKQEDQVMVGDPQEADDHEQKKIQEVEKILGAVNPLMFEKMYNETLSNNNVTSVSPHKYFKSNPQRNACDGSTGSAMKTTKIILPATEQHQGEGAKNSVEYSDDYYDN